MISLLRLTFIALAVSATINAQADSFASSASSAGSASSGSISDSIHGSSNSSSKNDKVADRDYHIVDVAEAPHHAGMARITLQANDSDYRVMLDLPLALVAKEQLHNGALVHAQQREYGIEFEHGEEIGSASVRAGQAFFLAINDDWMDELAARKVTL